MALVARNRSIVLLLLKIGEGCTLQKEGNGGDVGDGENWGVRGEMWEKSLKQILSLVLAEIKEKR